MGSRRVSRAGLAQSQPTGPLNGTHLRRGVVLSREEWQEISDCATALFAALQCYGKHRGGAWQLVLTVHERFLHALSPITERLRDEVHGEHE